MMTCTIVRYTVKPGLEELNAQLVRAVYRELADLQPERFRYATYVLDDGRSFVHVAEQDDGAKAPLSGLSAFKAFQAEIAERCEWGPVVMRAEQVGRYVAGTSRALDAVVEAID